MLVRSKHQELHVERERNGSQSSSGSANHSFQGGHSPERLEIGELNGSERDLAFNTQVSVRAALRIIGEPLGPPLEHYAVLGTVKIPRDRAESCVHYGEARLPCTTAEDHWLWAVLLFRRSTASGLVGVVAQRDHDRRAQRQSTAARGDHRAWRRGSVPDDAVEVRA